MLFSLFFRWLIALCPLCRGHSLIFLFIIIAGATALHAVEHGFRTVLVDNASKGLSIEDITATKNKLLSKGVVITESTQVSKMEGRGEMGGGERGGGVKV